VRFGQARIDVMDRQQKAGAQEVRGEMAAEIAQSDEAVTHGA
jgi:hypothetical protein